jgi:copper transport protein
VKSTTATLATAAANNLEVRLQRTALLVALAALLAPASAWAHASLVRTDPGNGAVLARSPAVVRVVFDDVVRVGPGIAAIRNGGGSILRGAARVQGKRTLVMPIRRDLPNGDYSVRWSIVSDDGHLESGVLAFAVGLARASPVAGLPAGATGPTVDSVGARWLLFAGVLGAAGIALFTFVVRPRDLERIPLVLSTAGVLAALGAAEEVHRVGLSTRDGKALGVAFVLALLVATGGAAATLSGRALRPALRVALLLAVVPSFAGHALDPGLGWVDVVADVLHVAAASAWVGVLLGLVAARGADVRRAGALALVAVALLGITGVTRALAELAALSQLWSTSYGRVLLVKTGLLLGALVAGWFVRTRPRERAVVELVLVAALVVAVSVLVELRPGRNVTTAGAEVQAAQPSPPPPPPPMGAVVVAREAGPLGVAIAVEPKRLTATILSPAGGGLSGLRVHIDGTLAVSCGSGCYTAVGVAPGRVVSVEVEGFGPRQHVTLAVPLEAVPADALVRRARAVYRALRSVSYRERLASDVTHAIVAHWILEKPNRVEYSIPGGAQGIIIGAKRWDREKPDGRWIESAQTPLPQPAPQWTYATNAHVLAQTSTTTTVSFVDPSVPAWFTVTFDRRTLRPRVLRMTASAHFMVDTYRAFNEPPVIRPPR